MCVASHHAQIRLEQGRGFRSHSNSAVGMHDELFRLYAFLRIGSGQKLFCLVPPPSGPFSGLSEMNSWYIGKLVRC